MENAQVRSRALLRLESVASQVISGDTTGAVYQQHVKVQREYMSQPRFQYVERPYTAEDVARFQGSQVSVADHPAAEQAKKLYTLLRQKQAEKSVSHTFGALDPVQVVQMAEAGLTSVYVSGWQSSSTASTSNEPGPDLADYPMDTVPNKVDQLFKAQCFHDRKQFENRLQQTPEWRAKNPATDYLLPIIADADTGHGGLTAVLKLTKMFIERGAAGIHLEDQKPGTKKCGHMGGKVLVSMEEHRQRIIAARLQADILRVPLIIVARTDAEAATLLDSNADPRDHPFILGATNPQVSEPLAQASKAGRGEKWDALARPMTYPELISSILKKQNAGAALKEWEACCWDLSLEGMKKKAKELGAGTPFFDWELCRVVEGYYRVRPGVKYCAQRGKCFGRVADMVWMETAKPGMGEAKEFAEDVHSVLPHLMLAYNQSPSFNWDASGLSDQEMATYIWDLAKFGYCWQFITLAGFHTDALAISLFARDYKKRGMQAYVTSIQRGEREHKVETLTHQKWSGSELVDAQLKVVTSGMSSTTIMSAGVTEKDF